MLAVGRATTTRAAAGGGDYAQPLSSRLYILWSFDVEDRLPGADTAYKLRQVIEHLRCTIETLLPKILADATVVLALVALYIEHLAAWRSELPICAIRQVISRERRLIFAVFALSFPGYLLGEAILALLGNEEINYADTQRTT